MQTFPAWYQIGDDPIAFPPKLFRTAEEVPPGWRRLNKHYNEQTGQWEEGDPLDHDGNGKKGGSLPQVDPMDLPAIVGFVTHGFDHDAPEAGFPPKRRALAERADEIVPDPEPGRNPKRRGKARKGTKKMGNDNAKGIARPQEDKPVSKPQSDPDATASERGEDGVVRTGNRPTRR